MALIVDTGPLVALLDASDPDHLRCDALLQQAVEPRIVPVCVLVEVKYMLRPWAGRLSGLDGGVRRRRVRATGLAGPLVAASGELVERYRDLPLGLVDATVIAATEMLGEPKVATLDHRRFDVVRPAHVEALAMVP